MVELYVHAGVLPKHAASWRPWLRPTEAVVICPGGERRELRADVAVIVAAPEVDVDDRRARRRALKTGQAYSVLLEFQSVIDAKRPDAWADHLAAYRLDLGGTISLVILTFDPNVAQWATLKTGPIEQLLRIFELLPEDCPRWSNVDPEREPERAVLNALLHARDDAELELIELALAAIGAVDELLGLDYEKMLVAQLGEPLIAKAITDRDKATATMPSTTSTTDLANSPRPIIRIAHQVGQREGLEEGLQKGLQEGLLKGELEARAKVVVEILDLRGVTLDPESRAQILACRAPETLAAWLGAALRVTSGAQLLETR